MSVQPHILVFDSGAGGLSVAKEILHKLPNCRMTYAADNAFYPYGMKQDQPLTERIIDQVGLLYEQSHPNIVVVACNTASTLALDTLRNKFKCPFVGVVPAIKPAASLSITRTIGVLATPATVSRIYTRNLIQEHAPDHTIILHGSNVLVELAEQKLSYGTTDVDALSHELELMFTKPEGNSIDTVVLACTHFPLLKKEMHAITLQKQRKVTWVDSGEAIARRVCDLLGSHYKGEKKKDLNILFSQKDQISRKKQDRYLAYLKS